jgi:tripartite-type tricarboxylate transporter receptor subunit TctC
MPDVRRRELIALLSGAAATLPAVARMAQAQSYPARPVRVIVPYAPGGPTDVFGRLIAQKLSDQFGRQFFVENIGGAGGNIGMGRAARADRDGHTVVIVATPLVINPSLYDTVPFDPIKDFDPVTLAVSTTTVVTAHPSVPAQTARELVALIRANPGTYSFGSPGTGTPSHLLGELFRLSLKLDLVHVPFNSGGLAIGSNLAGHTPLCFGTPPPALPHLKDGKLRALGVTSKTRVPTLPDVPTMAEAGYPEVEGESWFAVAVPGGTPKEITALLNREIVKIMALPDIKERLATLGFDSVASSPEEFGARIRTDAEKWSKVIRAANIKVAE